MKYFNTFVKNNKLKIMRNLIIGIISLLMLVTVSCKEESAKNGLNPYDTAIIKAAEFNTRSIIFDDITSYQDSIDSIFDQSNFEMGMTLSGIFCRGGLREEEIDRINKEFCLRNMWVVDQHTENGPYVLGALSEATELIIMRRYDEEGYKFDTIAYVPTKILFDTAKKLKAEFANENYDECRRLLQSEYTFKPIDAKGYEALKSQGLN